MPFTVEVCISVSVFVSTVNLLTIFFTFAVHVNGLQPRTGWSETFKELTDNSAKNVNMSLHFMKILDR